jgi:hypothetical protein
VSMHNKANTMRVRVHYAFVGTVVDKWLIDNMCAEAFRRYSGRDRH